MPRVAIMDLVPGSVLLRPVINKNGLILIAEGTELTESLIDKIRNMEVDSVYVRGAKRVLPNREEVLADLDRRFSKTESEPFMSLIKNAISHHIMSLYEENGSKDPQG
jgi:hypothetical protein